MNSRSTECLLAILVLCSTPLSAQPVTRDGKEWLQPADFQAYAWEDIAEVCPGASCSGFLPDSEIDLSGYTWASIEDINALYNSYSPDPPFGPGASVRQGSQLATGGLNIPLAAAEFRNSYDPAFVFLPSNEGVIGWLSDLPGSENSPQYHTAGFNRNTSRAGPVSFTYYAGGVGINSSFYDDDDIGAWFWRPALTNTQNGGVEVSCRLYTPGRPHDYDPLSSACDPFDGAATAQADLIDGALNVGLRYAPADTPKIADAGLVDLVTITAGWEGDGTVEVLVEVEITSSIEPDFIDGSTNSFFVVAWPTGDPAPPCLYDFDLCVLNRLSLPFSAVQFWWQAMKLESSTSEVEWIFSQDPGAVEFQRLVTFPLQVARENPSFHLGLSGVATAHSLGKQRLTAKVVAIRSESGMLEFSAKGGLGQALPGSQPPESKVSLSGAVMNTAGDALCTIVLASGQYMFTCDPQGDYALSGLFREEDGTVNRQIYADGYLPRIENLPGSVHENVTLSEAGACTQYNEPAYAVPMPAKAGMMHRVSGRVLLQDTMEPVCALVLVNGAHMFSCSGDGSYSVDFPLDSNGQFSLQVYADGFAPTIQVFDASSTGGDVRMASAAECE